MPSLKRIAFGLFARYRAAQVRQRTRDAVAVQQRLMLDLVRRAANTEFGRQHDFAKIRSYDDFRRAVPIRGYEELRPWIQRAYEGQPDVLWPGRPRYFAKTSGTTSGAKYIPLTRESMPNQVKGARDALLLYVAETGRSQFLDGKMIFLSGSPALENNKAGIPTGRLSGIAQHYVPNWLLRNRLPSWDTNCIEDWEQKVAAIVQETKDADMRVISGIPPWVQMFAEKLQSQTGQLPGDRWPNLQLFIHGGVDYAPYQPVFERALGRRVDVVEVFPASEGFFAVQGSQQDEALLLMPDYGVFFEFVPLEEYGKPDARRMMLDEVEVGQNYALILSSNAGLWAYDIGDAVKFYSREPWRIRVSGRVKHFISAFGEHVIAEEVNAALLAAAQATGAEVTEFTVAPFVSEQAGQSYHEWFVEFGQPPTDLAQFQQVLDDTLRHKNVYYDDLRRGNMLLPPPVRVLRHDAARDYMRSIGKLGGQNKFTRLRNDREVADALAEYVVG
jgi:hypothetical protein